MPPDHALDVAAADARDGRRPALLGDDRPRARQGEQRDESDDEELVAPGQPPARAPTSEMSTKTVARTIVRRKRTRSRPRRLR